MYRLGPVQRKIILVLLGGVALGFSSSSRQYFKTFRKITKEWKKIDQRSFSRSIRKLSSKKLVEEKYSSDGSFELVLTEEGRQLAKRLSFMGDAINFKKPKRWDRRWRLVFFDIPEKDRDFRDILRDHLYNLNFFKIQKSVFVSPHPFEKQILELVKLYSAEPYVRVITAMYIDNEAKIKNYFFKSK